MKVFVQNKRSKPLETKIQPHFRPALLQKSSAFQNRIRPNSFHKNNLLHKNIPFSPLFRPTQSLSFIKGQPSTNIFSKKPRSFITPFENAKQKIYKTFCSRSTLPKAGWPAQLQKAYQPKEVESGWYDRWETEGYFQINAPHKEERSEKEKFPKRPFSMVLPPPNITGQLHVGHTLTIAIQDALVRYKKMNGFPTLWVPGLDHAGIATQVVVEKRLKKEGLDRKEMGKDAFIEKIWHYKEEFEKNITNQLKRTGASLDWTKKVFTMDENSSEAVFRAFEILFEKGLITKGQRIVNWCPKLGSVISDIEVAWDNLEVPEMRKMPGVDQPVPFGKIYYLAFPVQGMKKDIVIATTRPETVFGDVAIAVHPNDPRYKDLKGKQVYHPFLEQNIPIIYDERLVDMELGTGAVKVTPAHDVNDFTCARRHNLKWVNIFDHQGNLNQAAGQFKGLNRWAARNKVIEMAKNFGILQNERRHIMKIPICSRTGDIIEPMLQPQWFLETTTMAEMAKAYVSNGGIKLTPNFHEVEWERWLKNPRPWCISRQLWWGHPVPVYQIFLRNGQRLENKYIVARSVEEAEEKAAREYRVKPQDVIATPETDVLDTWFSSALFPLVALGWPQNPIPKDLYPLSLMETGSDILFFWVARMVMLCDKLTEKPPFKEVLLHPLVRDSQGRKMSKSLGNVIDPLDVIEGKSLSDLLKGLSTGNLDSREVVKASQLLKAQFPSGIAECGADGLRAALIHLTEQQGGLNMDPDLPNYYRNFCNKIWQSMRYLHQFEHHFAELDANNEGLQYIEAHQGELTVGEQWILSRLSRTVKTCFEAPDTGKLFKMIQSVENFFWKDFCDYFLEFTKVNVPKDQKSARRILQVYVTCFATTMKLLHPIMPFITEELYHRLPGISAQDILVTEIFPNPKYWDKWENSAQEEQFGLIQSLISHLRDLLKTTNNQKPNAIILMSTNDHFQEILEKQQEYFSHMSKLSGFSFEIGDVSQVNKEKGNITRLVSPNVRLYADVPKKNFRSEIQTIQNQLNRLQLKLDSELKTSQDPNFLVHAPLEIQQRHKQTREKIKFEIQSLKERKQNLEALHEDN